MRFILFVSIIVITMTGCEKKPEPVSDLASDSLAFQLAQTSCFSCHNPDPTVKAGVAPSLASVKTAWMKASGSRNQFVDDMTAFVLNPSADQSKMLEAVASYGLMPALPFKPEDLRLIAGWIADTPVENPEWFSSLQGGNEMDSLGRQIMKIGQEKALAAKSVLGKNLIGAIQSTGTLSAMEFCNDRAHPLTDSMSVVQGVSIRRVSDQPRNPLNDANPDQLQIIERMKKALAAGQLPQPELAESDNFHTGYYPIETNKMCLQCHGKQETDIAPAVSKKTRELYPSDRATGYTENQIRGIWVVEMKKDSQ